jgi:glycosyltransferase involved in cell wall biosynthesis
MDAHRHRITFVIPTKDRPDELRRLVRSLADQSAPAAEIVIVDGGERPLGPFAADFPGLPIRVLRHRPPSATRQRNVGIAAVGPEATLIGILDDDSVLAPDAVREMLSFWDTAAGRVGGASFNLVNHPGVFAAALKRLPLCERLGLYSARKGAVLPSGFQVMIVNVTADLPVQWLPSGTSVWRREVFRDFRFDEWFGGYSYLEDLDFSYRVGREYDLVVVAAARQFHYPSPRGRLGGYRFGRREVVNRLHFVRKNPELSSAKCYLALTVRAGMSLAQAVRRREAYYLERMAGNIVGLLASLV